MLRVLCSMLALIGFLAAGLAKAEEKKPKAGPSLILKGKDCLIHAVSNMAPAEEGEESRRLGGQQLLYTATATGEMKTLVLTGSWSEPTRRISYRQNGILGIASDEERLYVLIGQTARSYDRPAWKNPESYTLKVFWLADGSLISDKMLGGGDLPKELGKQTTDKGPLSVKDSAVTCFGNTVAFKKKEVVKPETKDK